ncbi:pro-resilin-like isoform X2 [Notolabrus celidotus]|uniref:pro-resilin-like isoform X2 n=1 Tax=Notolabrus celidotus TaxID=1203425 RepID=UPI0014904E25|nr:pro-resilin-like isoform X2 [Notolabrus celidotus]
MLHALSLRVSWICLLLFSSGACFPATKDDYQYPYTAAVSSDEPTAQLSLEEPSYQSESDVSDNLSPRSGAQLQPSAVQEPAEAQQAPAAAAATSWATYQPATYDVSSASRPARAPQGSGHVGAPSFHAQSQPQAAPAAVPYAAPAAVSYAAPAAVSYAAPAAVSYAAPAAVSYAAPGASYGGFGAGSYGAPGASHGGFNAPAASHGGFGAGSYGAPGASHGGFNAPAASHGGFASAGPAYESTILYSGAPSFSFEGSTFGSEWSALPTVGFESFNPNGWMPSRSLPDFSVWGSQEEAAAAAAGVGSKGVKGVQQAEEEVETFSVPASSYIVQTRNGYQRAREVSSHMNYSPEVPEPEVVYYEVVQKAVPQAEPVKGGKGGKY